MELSGLNQHLTPVTPARLNRWVLLVAPFDEPLCLSPVTVLQCGITVSCNTPSSQRQIPLFQKIRRSSFLQATMVGVQKVTVLTFAETIHLTYLYFTRPSFPEVHARNRVRI